jgi:hypothetical protein
MIIGSLVIGAFGILIGAGWIYFKKDWLGGLEEEEEVRAMFFPFRWGLLGSMAFIILDMIIGEIEGTYMFTYLYLSVTAPSFVFLFMYQLMYGDYDESKKGGVLVKTILFMVITAGITVYLT